MIKKNVVNFRKIMEKQTNFESPPSPLIVAIKELDGRKKQ